MKWLAKPARERTHMVWGVNSTIGPGCWPVSVFSIDVPLDEAAALSSPVWGGPLVLLAPHGPVRRPFGAPLPFTDAWTVWVRAFIMEEAYGTLRELQELLPGSELGEVFTPTRWRLRDGELVPLEPWEWPKWRLHPVDVQLTVESDPGPIEIA